MQALMRGGAAAALLLAAMAIPLMPSPAQFGGGRPKMPPAKVIETYSQTVATEHLTITPVSAGIGPLGAPEQALDRPGINPAVYRSSIAGLQGYVVALAKVGPRPDVIPRVTLVLSDRTEAYAKSQSEIVLSTGLLKLLADRIAKDPESVNELLFILAHEYSHTLYNHPQLFAARAKERGVASAFSRALSVAASINRVSGQLGGGAALNGKAIGTLQGAYSLSPYIETELYRFGYAPYQREQEMLADFMAADLMRRMERRDPREGSMVLLIFEHYDNSLIGQLQAGLKHLNEEAGKAMTQLQASAPQALFQSGPGAVLNNAQRGLMAAARRTAIDAFKRRLSKPKIHVYYSADKREEGVQTYDGRFYQPIPAAANAATISAWASVAKVVAPQTLAATFARENAADAAASRARGLLLKGDVAGARAAMDAAKGPGLKPASFYIVDAQTYQFSGDLKNAVEAYRRAVALPDAPVTAYLQLASAQDVIGRSAEAFATLEAGGRRFGEDLVIVAKIRHLVALGQVDAAQPLLAKCAAYPEVRHQCDAALPNAKDDDDQLFGIL